MLRFGRVQAKLAEFPAQGKEQGIFSRAKIFLRETLMNTGDSQLLRELTGK